MNARVIDNVITVDVGVDTAAHAANDCVFQPVELVDIANAGGCAIIQSVVVIDYDDQGAVLDLVFLSDSVGVGANNATFAISDNNASKVLGHVRVASADYLDLDQNQIGTATNCGLLVKPDPNDGGSDRSIWMAGKTTGTPTYAGGVLTVRVGVLRG